jgi:hypothetical protein
MVHDTSLLVNKSMSLVRGRKEKWLGGFIKDYKLFIYLDDNNDTSIHNWTIDLSAGTKDEHLININKKNERPVKYISNNGHFVSVTLNKKTDDLSVNDFYNGSQYNSLQYHLTTKKWNELFNVDTVVKKLPEIEYVNSSAVSNLAQAACIYKLYLENDTLSFVINNQADITRVLSFNLKDQKVNERIIKHNLCSAGKVYTSYLLFRDNSFLLKNKLYYAQVSTDSLCVQVCDFSTGKMLKTFTAQRNEEIWFRNSDITQQTAGQIDGFDTLNKTRKLLRKMYNNEVIIAAFENGDNVELTVGASEIRQGGGGGFSGGYYSGGFSTPGGYVPSTYVAGSGGSFWGFGQSNFRKFTIFKVQLDSLSNHLKGQAGPSDVEKLIRFKDDIKTSRETENLFVLKGVTCYAYYNKKKKTIEIVGL